MFTLDQVVPWGRSFAEYRATVRADARRSRAAASSGAATARPPSTPRPPAAAAASSRAIRCMPSAASEIEARIAATCDTVLEQTRRHADQFVWGHGIASIDELGEVRMRAMRVFLEDYDAGKAAGRYVEAEFARPAVRGWRLRPGALLAPAVPLQRAVRRGVPPRVDPRAVPRRRRGPRLPAARPRWLALAVRRRLRRGSARGGCRGRAVRVPYEFQRGGNEMLRLRRSAAAS